MAWYHLAMALLLAIAYLYRKLLGQTYSDLELPVVAPSPGEPLSHALEKAYEQVKACCH